ncbi:hypothetical protein ElyMa_005613400 [Elysia marginata]|uniref:Uncharacterized protein n=1 Tax=Elysia marginata TaxID=1093978 RepID=A0AAV4F5Y4_9GAST|nr:hypothetical protein ElyMa_005613400 [Elysia marginata]
MELDVSKIKRTQPLALKTKPSEKSNERQNSFATKNSFSVNRNSAKRQGESYVERLAKSRARNSASNSSKAQSNTLEDDCLEPEAMHFAQFVRKHSYANKELWSDTDFTRNASQLHSALADLVSADIRQSPQRSMSFASTPLSINENRKTRRVYSPLEQVEVNDADFDSDGDEKTKTIAKEDIVSLYERACRMAGITSSSRIARELANSRVFLDYAALNTQDIKAVCVALLVSCLACYSDCA